MKEKKRQRRLRNVFIALYIAVIVVLAGWIYILPRVSDALTPTVVLEYGQMQVMDQVTCYIVRNEQVVNASHSGTPTYYAEEGGKYRKGVRIADVAGAGYNCPVTGIISYYYDGMEGQYTPQTMHEMELVALTEGEEDETDALLQPKNIQRDSVSSGEPLYKVVENDVWYAVCRVESASIVKYQQGAKVAIMLPTDTVTGRVDEIVDKGSYWMVILKFDRYYEEMPRLRRLSATVITSDNSGILVPNESLTQQDGKSGVYVKGINGNYSFTRVKIIATDGEYSLVESGSFNENTQEGTEKVSTVDIYDEIQRHPPSGERSASGNTPEGE